MGGMGGWGWRILSDACDSQTHRPTDSQTHRLTNSQKVSAAGLFRLAAGVEEPALILALFPDGAEL